MNRPSMKSTPLKIAYSPFENDANEYTRNMKSLLSAFGSVEKIPGFKSIIKNRMFRCFDLFIVNWSDNAFINERGGLNLRLVLKESLRLLAYRLAARKILFVRHNMFPHATRPSSQGAAKLAVDFYERLFHMSWVHSGHMATPARHYVPHPLYGTQEDDDPLWSELKLPEKYFIVFGRILPYKKIEELLAVLPPDINLVVAGSAPDAEYLQTLRRHESANVILIPRFISDSLAKKLIGASLGTVICNADEDMIVSGSMVFSISIGVPVIALETPFGLWFRNNVNPNMIINAGGLVELVEKMRSYSTRASEDDIRAAQAHFSDQTVQQKMLSSFNTLGLM